MLTQGGGVFGTFVSSFYLQFSHDGRRWYTYKELVTHAQPRAKVSCYTLYFLFLILCNSFCFLYRFSLVTMMIGVWQRSTWTGWCLHDSYACFRMTSRMASTCDWRSWAAEMVLTLFNSTLMMLLPYFYPNILSFAPRLSTVDLPNSPVHRLPRRSLQRGGISLWKRSLRPGRCAERCLWWSRWLWRWIRREILR